MSVARTSAKIVTLSAILTSSLLAVSVSGCSSFGRNQPEMVDPFNITSIQLFNRDDDSKSLKNPFKKDDTSSPPVPGYLKQEEKKPKGKPSNLTAKESLNLFHQAENYVKQKDYAAAEDILKDLISDLEHDDNGLRKRTLSRFFSQEDRTPYYTDIPLREDSMFLLAEILFAQQKFPEAEEYYSGLLKEYPSTKYLTKSTQKLFEIAGHWMDLKITKSDDVVKVSYTTEGTATTDKLEVTQEVEKSPFVNFTDSTKPRIDIEGRALNALKTIWINDPTGPLADDALMLEASHFLRKGEYVRARESFRLLREEYPNSPHIKDAYILSSYVTQVSYEGPNYEDKFLEESRGLKRATLQQFGDLSAEQREHLEQELKQLDEATVLREIERARLYMKKGKLNAVELYCNYIINAYPKSAYVPEAKNLIAQVNERRANPRWNDNIPLLTQDQGPSPWDAKPQAGPDNAPENQPGLKKTDSLPTLRSISVPKFWKGKPEEPPVKEDKQVPEA